MLIRTWNLFHGNAKPPERRDFLEEMVRLASEDRPGLLCLQEVPAWALAKLDDWSGMAAFAEVAAPPRLGPFPSSAEIGRRVTSLHHGRLRSAFSGQANAILVGPTLEALDYDALPLNPRSFRVAESRRLGLDFVERLAWGKERRVCQALRVRLEDGRTALVANFHASSVRDLGIAEAEVRRAATYADALAEPNELCVLAGDFNVAPELSGLFAELEGEWGFSPVGPGIDHVLVRGLEAGPEERWPVERRTLGGRVLSDHTPVERTVP